MSTNLEDQIAGFDPTNPEALAALELAAIDGESPAHAEPVEEKKVDEPVKLDEKKLDEAAATDAAPADDSKGATSGVLKQEMVIQAKDGVHTIPYTVLERERERAARAEATAEALADQIKQIQEGKTAAPTDVQLSDDDLQQLEQDLPGVAKVIRAQMAMLEKLTGTVQTLQRGQEVVERSAEQVRRDEEEAAIAASETLTALKTGAEAGDQRAAARWNRVVDVYATMRDDPELFALDTAKLITKAEAAVVAMYGPIAPEKKPEPNTADLQKAADAKLREVPAAVPTTLSDIPGGTPPAQSHIETLENASPIALGQRFLAMTQDQLESELARFGT